MQGLPIAVAPLIGSTTETFDRRSRIVANTIDRKERYINSIDQVGQQTSALLDAAIVVKKISTKAFDHEFSQLLQNATRQLPTARRRCIEAVRVIAFVAHLDLPAVSAGPHARSNALMNFRVQSISS
jgi:hypothetical protein